MRPGDRRLSGRQRCHAYGWRDGSSRWRATGFSFRARRELRVRRARLRCFPLPPSAALLRLLQAALLDELRPFLDVGAKEFLERRGILADRFESDPAQLG